MGECEVQRRMRAVVKLNDPDRTGAHLFFGMVKSYGSEGLATWR